MAYQQFPQAIALTAVARAACTRPPVRARTGSLRAANFFNLQAAAQEIIDTLHRTEGGWLGPHWPKATGATWPRLADPQSFLKGEKPANLPVQMHAERHPRAH